VLNSVSLLAAHLSYSLSWTYSFWSHCSCPYLLNRKKPSPFSFLVSRLRPWTFLWSRVFDPLLCRASSPLGLRASPLFLQTLLHSPLQLSLCWPSLFKDWSFPSSPYSFFNWSRSLLVCWKTELKINSLSPSFPPSPILWFSFPSVGLFAPSLILLVSFPSFCLFVCSWTCPFSVMVRDSFTHCKHYEFERIHGLSLHLIELRNRYSLKL